MDNDQERDYAEEKYNRELCPECGYSPCILTKEYDPHRSAELHQSARMHDLEDGVDIWEENQKWFNPDN